MEGASFMSSRSMGFRPAPNVSVVGLASNNNQKSLTPILDRFKVLLKEREEEIRVSSGVNDDEVPVLTTEEIVELYDIVLSDLVINSKPTITDLTIIAGEQKQHGEGIADAICARIIEAPVDHKLPSLYLLDSIVKNIGREYVRHFSACLPQVYCVAYRQVHQSLRPSMRHLFSTWSTVFPSSVLRKIEVQLQFSPASSNQTSSLKDSESPRPTHGIHVNPKYLEARRKLENSSEDSKIQHARAISAPKVIGHPSTGSDDYESDNGEVPSSHSGVQSGSASRLGRTPFGLGHARPPSPVLEEIEGASPSHHGHGYRPGGATAGDDDSRDLPRSHPSGVSNEFDIQRPRALINAYGTDERNKTTNTKLRGQNLTVNGIGSKVGGKAWQNAEEEEFEWEDMSPTLADRGRGVDLISSSISLPGSSKMGHAHGPNGRNGLGRGDWSNKEMLPEVALSNTASLGDRGFKRKITGFPNEPSDIPISHEQPWAAPHRYNSLGRRPPLESFPGVNPQQHLFSLPKLSSPSLRRMNPEVSIPTTRGAWQPPFHTQFPPQLSLPKEIGPNIIPPSLGFNPSHLATRPMIRGYAHQRFASSGNATLNPVLGMHSSVPLHLHGVGMPHLPPGLPPLPQLPLSTVPPPAGGGALSGLFSSLVAKGLLSLTKSSSEQDSVGLEFDLDVLKARHESAITALYADLPRQCKTCGLRFKLQEEHSNHMDWHVTKNRVSKNHKQKASQKWFANVSVWLCSAEALGTDPVPGFLLQSENIVENKDDNDMAVPADEDQNVCALCGEPFDDFYSDETEEWMYRGAVYMNAPAGSTVGMDRSQLGPIVHAKCRSESTVVPPDDSGNNGQVFLEQQMRS